MQSLLSNKEAVKEVEDEKTVGLYELTKKIQSLVLRRDEAYQAYKQLFAEKEGLSHAEVQSIEKVEQLTEKHILSYQDVQYIERNWQYENKQLQNEKRDCKEKKPSCNRLMKHTRYPSVVLRSTDSIQLHSCKNSSKI